MNDFASQSNKSLIKDNITSFLKRKQTINLTSSKPEEKEKKQPPTIKIDNIKKSSANSSKSSEFSVSEKSEK